MTLFAINDFGMTKRRTFATRITGALVYATCASLMLLLKTGTALAEALPVFSLTGPDAAAYGAAEGYPPGRPGTTMNAQPFIVGSYSHFDEILQARVVPRSTKASAFSRAPQELALAYTHQGSPQTIETYLERHPATALWWRAIAPSCTSITATAARTRSG